MSRRTRSLLSFLLLSCFLSAPYALPTTPEGGLVHVADTEATQFACSSTLGNSLHYLDCHLATFQIPYNGNPFVFTEAPVIIASESNLPRTFQAGNCRIVVGLTPTTLAAYLSWDTIRLATGKLINHCVAGVNKGQPGGLGGTLVVHGALQITVHKADGDPIAPMLRENSMSNTTSTDGSSSSSTS